METQEKTRDAVTVFVEYLREYFRRPDSLSQRVIAAKAGIHWVTLNRLIHGKHIPPLSEADAVIRATGTTLGRILVNAESQS